MRCANIRLGYRPPSPLALVGGPLDGVHVEPALDPRAHVVHHRPVRVILSLAMGEVEVPSEDPEESRTLEPVRLYFACESCLEDELREVRAMGEVVAYLWGKDLGAYAHTGDPVAALASRGATGASG